MALINKVEMTPDLSPVYFHGSRLCYSISQKNKNIVSMYIFYKSKQKVQLGHLVLATETRSVQNNPV